MYIKHNIYIRYNIKCCTKELPNIKSRNGLTLYTTCLSHIEYQM